MTLKTYYDETIDPAYRDTISWGQHTVTPAVLNIVQREEAAGNIISIQSYLDANDPYVRHNIIEYIDEAASIRINNEIRDLGEAFVPGFIYTFVKNEIT